MSDISVPVGQSQEAALLSYFHCNGMLLCNKSQELPYLESVGGNWNAIVTLIESGQVFYSKLYKGRVTYLSREFYAQMKPHRQKLDNVSTNARRVYDFLKESGQSTTPQLRDFIMLSQKELTSCLNELFSSLLVTAIKRERTINTTWSSFYWGTFEAWERLHPVDDVAVSPEALAKLTSNLLTEKALKCLLK